MNCAVCDRANRDGAKFCAACGAPLGTAGPVFSTTGPGIPEPPTIISASYGSAPRGPGSPQSAHQPPAPTFPPPPQIVQQNIIHSNPSNNGLAVASLVLSLLWLCGIGSLLAVIFGHIARGQIKRSNGRETGAGLALAGLILGYLPLVIGVAFFFVGLASNSSQ